VYRACEQFVLSALLPIFIDLPCFDFHYDFSLSFKHIHLRLNGFSLPYRLSAAAAAAAAPAATVDSFNN
jgi:hypothetical protein